MGGRHEHDPGLGLSVPGDSSSSRTRARLWVRTVTRTEEKTRPTPCSSDYGGRTGVRGRVEAVGSGASAKGYRCGVSKATMAR